MFPRFMYRVPHRAPLVVPRLRNRQKGTELQVLLS